MPTIPASVRVLAGITVLVLAACDSTGSTEGTTPEPASEAADLASTSWTLASVGGNPVVEGSGAGLAFDDTGNVSGSTGCNGFSGTYALDGPSLTFGPLSTTRMACEDALMAQETTVLEALAGVEGWEIDEDGNLHLTGGTELVLEPSAA